MLGSLSPAQLLLLSLFVFFAGIVDALAGGGGLITLPAYLAAGLSPALVLGTNKLASSIGTVGASVHYHWKQRHPLRALAPALAAAVAGSYLGARLNLLLDPALIKPLLLLALPLVAFFVYSKHSFGRADRSGELTHDQRLGRSVGVALPIGAYDGFIGPGTGTFFALALSRACRYDLLGATARAKYLNLATNIAALAAFLAAGRVRLGLGLAMGGVSLAGNLVGSHLGLKKGAEVIRPVVILVLAGLFIKLGLDLLK
jgi:uncharacterized membrane protein YfcA